LPKVITWFKFCGARGGRAFTRGWVVWLCWGVEECRAARLRALPGLRVTRTPRSESINTEVWGCWMWIAW